MNHKIEDLNIDLLPRPKGAVAYYGSKRCSKLQLAKKAGAKSGALDIHALMV